MVRTIGTFLGGAVALIIWEICGGRMWPLIFVTFIFNIPFYTIYALSTFWRATGMFSLITTSISNINIHTFFIFNTYIYYISYVLILFFSLFNYLFIFSVVLGYGYVNKMADTGITVYDVTYQVSKLKKAYICTYMHIHKFYILTKLIHTYLFSSFK